MKSGYFLIFVLLVLGGVACTTQKDPDKNSGTNDAFSQGFQCRGKTHCSQMTSCEEAMFYLKNCPGTKIDGDGDGIPCEKQW